MDFLSRENSKVTNYNEMNRRNEYEWDFMRGKKKKKKRKGRNQEEKKKEKKKILFDIDQYNIEYKLEYDQLLKVEIICH